MDLTRTDFRSAHSLMMNHQQNMVNNIEPKTTDEGKRLEEQPQRCTLERMHGGGGGYKKYPSKIGDNLRGRVFKQAVIRVKHLFGEQEEPFSSHTSIVQPLL